MEDFTADNSSASQALSTNSAGMDGGAAAQTTRSQGEFAQRTSLSSVSKSNTNVGFDEPSAQATEGSEDVSRTKAFSKRLNEISEKRAKEAESNVRKEFEGHSELLEALKNRGYEGSAGEIAGALLSEIEQGSREGKSNEISNDHPYFQWARDIIDDRTFESDLAAIKAAYPEIKHSSVWEIGDVYIKLMASGAVDALTAYEAQRSFDNRQTKPVPPSIGPAKSGGLVPDKEFYTPEEVDRLSKTDYENPKIMQRVRKSMTLWK